MNFDDLHLEVGALQHLADTQPEVAKLLYYFALAMVMVERGKMSILKQETIDQHRQYTFANPGGEVLTLARPDVAEPMFNEMMNAVRAVVEEEFRILAEHPPGS